MTKDDDYKETPRDRLHTMEESLERLMFGPETVEEMRFEMMVRHRKRRREVLSNNKAK